MAATRTTGSELLAENVRRLRAANGWTQTKLAEISGISQPNVSRIERGTWNSTVDTLDMLAAAFGISVSELFEEHDRP